MKTGFMDAMNVIMGKDLEEEKKPTKKATVKKPATSEKKPEKKVESEKTTAVAKKKEARPDMSTQDALLDAFEYAGSEQVSKDLQDALRKKPVTDDLRKLLEVLVDNDSFRALLLAQGDVKKPEPKPGEYTIKLEYIGADGKPVSDEVIETFKKTGSDFAVFGVKTLGKRIDKDGKVIGDATEAEVAHAVKLEIEAEKKAEGKTS